jgi:hypothetical protein
VDVLVAVPAALQPHEAPSGKSSIAWWWWWWWCGDGRRSPGCCEEGIQKGRERREQSRCSLALGRTVAFGHHRQGGGGGVFQGDDGFWFWTHEGGGGCARPPSH